MKAGYLIFLFIMTFSLSVSSQALAKKDAGEELSLDSLAEANAALESSFKETKEKVNIAVDADSEAGKALEAAKEKAAKIAVNPAWAGLEPKVEVGKWGQEIRIIVRPHPGMKSEGVMAIKSVRLETPEGEFLGLKTYAAEEKVRDAEFMVNPELLKIEAVKITVSSSSIGEYAVISSLTPSEPQAKAEEIVPVTPAAPKAAAPVKETAVQAEEAVKEVKTSEEKPKKKKGWW